MNEISNWSDTERPRRSAAAWSTTWPWVDVVAKQYRRKEPKVAKAQALVAVSATIGAVMMSRIVTDP